MRRASREPACFAEAPNEAEGEVEGSSSVVAGQGRPALHQQIISVSVLGFAERLAVRKALLAAISFAPASLPKARMWARFGAPQKSKA